MYPVPATMFNFLVVVERNKSVSRYSNCRSRYGDIYKDNYSELFQEDQTDLNLVVFRLALTILDFNEFRPIARI